MSRTLNQIYAEAVAARNNYMQVTEMDTSTLSNSKVSIINLMTYVMAMLIYSYETTLDLFQVNVSNMISERITGTPAWYVSMARKFQFNPTTGAGDQLVIDEQTYAPVYSSIDETHRIVQKAAYDIPNGDIDTDLIIKVCRDSSNSSNKNLSGTTYSPLTSGEMNAFVAYMEQIKFVGAKLKYISCPGDSITLHVKVYYDDVFISKETAFNNVKEALVNYASSLEYNDNVYYQKIIDVIQSTTNIVDVDAEATISVCSYNMEHEAYNNPQPITNKYKPVSGYITFLSPGGTTTLNEANIQLIPYSSL